MIIETLDESLFIRRFEDYNRTDNFSYPALRVLFNYLHDLSEDIGEPMELDVIAICCDYSEMTISDLWNDYSHLFEDLSRDDFEDDDELNEAMLDILRENTLVLEVEHYSKDSTYIIGAF